MRRFETLLSADSEPSFRFIDPPFDFNSGNVSKYGLEVTGYHVLTTLCRRLGWTSLAGHRLLDFGCGVRFTRAIINLGLDIGFCAGVDVHAKAIRWLQDNIADARFRFEYIDMRNPVYNPEGAGSASLTAPDMGLVNFEAACMYSVITHQKPDDAQTILAMLSRCVKPDGSLYFTAFTDASIERYSEGNPASPGAVSVYNPDTLIELAERAGWVVCKIYAGATVNQPAFVCRRKS